MEMPPGLDLVEIEIIHPKRKFLRRRPKPYLQVSCALCGETMKRSRFLPNFMMLNSVIFWWKEHQERMRGVKGIR